MSISRPHVQSELVSLFDLPALTAWRKEHALDPYLIRGLRNRLLKQFLPDSDATRDFPESRQLALHCLELHQRRDSEIDGATKLLFRTSAGMLIESVILRIASGRTTLCLSSQVGCAAACDFCATGRMGIAHNLTASEMLDQVLQAGQILTSEQRRLHNIVFMGMGEPFHNEQALNEVLETLIDTRQFDRSPGSLLVSTVGIPDAMVRCAARFPRVNLALSLHSVDPEVRRSIIPLAARYPLEELRRAITEANRLQSRPLMIEYLMLTDRNDSLKHAQDLAAWVTGLNVHINLIPFNPVEDAPHLAGSSREVIDAFSHSLKQAGFKVTIRHSLGSDIAAACGQLVRKENRRRSRASSPE